MHWLFKAIFCAGAVALIASPVLALVGFGSAGITAGSPAAAWHSSIGNVAAPCAFSTLQSAGMGGAGGATVSGVAAGIGAAMSFFC